MKLRILGNSIRLRLTQTEVGNLVHLGRILETTQFGPNSRLVYELVISKNSEIAVDFQDRKISVLLPKKIGEPWANSSEVSIRQDIQMDEKCKLSVLIEKDFKCQTKRAGENEADMFPNPHC